MASVKVAVRVRPLNKRELNMKSQFIIDMEDKKTTIRNLKAADTKSIDAQKAFTYDHSYWTVDQSSLNYADQQQVFGDLGIEVVNSAYQGYNACVFAYGQTGSGKTYTMMGNPIEEGLIPRICKELFVRMKEDSTTYRTEVSYLEIYNEKVGDLLKGNNKLATHSLRVREHPKEGPYVQDLSKHLVVNYEDIQELMNKGNSKRTTASTNMNDVSSRSHAIFTIVFTQAKFSNNTPSETHSKIHLVDLAGSERADSTGATGQRLKEGSSINKSLVTLGNVISTLAELGSSNIKRQVFIPYRDSVLTWLLKDSLGGNSKTIMIATISPADCNYAETLSTLRYANRAKNIINKPTVNEDSNVKLIKELRAEISRLRTLLGGNIDNIVAPKVREKLHESEARVKILTEVWTEKWKEAANILQEEKALALRKEGLGIFLDSDLPHLIGIDDDLLSTGIMLYHLKEGKTTVGSSEGGANSDIVLSGSGVNEQHCIIENDAGTVTLIPTLDAECIVNGNQLLQPTKLSQGAVILLGKTNMFRFNNPSEAAKLRKEFSKSNMTKSLSQSRASLLSHSMTDLAKSTENLGLITSGWEMELKHREQLEALEQKRQEIEELEERFRQAELARFTEQDEKEKVLDKKRQLLDQMQKEAESQKIEAKKAQELIAKETNKLKQRSIDIENKYLEYRKEKSRFDAEQAELEKVNLSCSPLSPDLDRLKKEKEMLIEQSQHEINLINQTMRELSLTRETTFADINSKCEKLTENKLELQKQIKMADEEILNQKKDLQEKRNKDVGILEKQKHLLNTLNENFSEFSNLSSELSTRFCEKFSSANKSIHLALENISSKEKKFMDEYRENETKMKQEYDENVKKLKKECTSFEADKIYINDCEQILKEKMKDNSLLTNEERLQLDKELSVLSDEKIKLKKLESDLKSQELQLNCQQEKNKLNLLALRDSQINELNSLKLELSNLNLECSRVVEAEIEATNNEITSAVTRFDLDLLSINESDASTGQWRKELEDKIDEYQSQFEILKKEECSKVSMFHSEQELLITQLSVAKEKLEFEIIELNKKQEKLSLSDMSANQSVYSNKEYAPTVEKDIILPDSPNKCEDFSSIPVDKYGKESPTKTTGCQSDLEAELGEDEAKYATRRLQLDKERQLELDRIDEERYRLEEMENQERINSLVEIEVKKRLLEERVTRETQRRVEREKEHEERKQELQKIRIAHNRELERLRQKYENSSSVLEIQSNNPTRANPYASVTSGDATPHRLPRSTSSDMFYSSLPSQVINSHQNRLIDINIPSYVLRGKGFGAHIEFEIKIVVKSDSWSIYRRYNRFRELHEDLRKQYLEINALVFPCKKWFANRSDRVASERRLELEHYLKNCFDILQKRPACPLNPANVNIYSKHLLWNFHPFFKRGLFENSKHATG